MLVFFENDGLLAPRPTHKLEKRPFSSVRDCLFDTFVATLRVWRVCLIPEVAPCCVERDPLNSETGRLQNCV
jgi:hypothetical protein